VNERLRLELGIPCPDDVYAMLIDMHRNLTEEQSHRANAKLILLLANHIGDPEVITEAIAIAREKPQPSPGEASPSPWEPGGTAERREPDVLTT
jgi:hypothetical protein